MSPKRLSKAKRFLISGVAILGASSCASKILEYKNVEKLEENVEYEELIQVKEIPGQTAGKSEDSEKSETSNTSAEASKEDGKKAIKPKGKDKPADKKAVKNQSDKKKPKAAGKPKPVVQLQPKQQQAGAKMGEEKPRQPDYEDSEDFVGRRPESAPFRVGEKVRLQVSYFKMTAGYMDLKVMPFVEVNGEKSYSFEVDLKTSSFFSRIYTVDDMAQTFLDFNTLLPYNLTMKIRESKQIKEIRSVFNHNDLSASYWSKKVNKDGKEKEKKVKWEIKPYSQNVVSALYYLRTFNLTPGKKLQFRVADDGKNFMFTGEVVRKEKLTTDIGTFDTVVVKPRITDNGMFKQMGDILIWLTDDERKFPVRIESEIKIGTLVAKLKSIEKGQP